MSDTIHQLISYLSEKALKLISENRLREAIYTSKEVVELLRKNGEAEHADLMELVINQYQNELMESE